MARRLVFSIILLSLILGGCKSSRKAATRPMLTGSGARVTDAPPAPEGRQISTADVLAMKTQSYAADMAAMMAQRGKNPAGGANAAAKRDAHSAGTVAPPSAPASEGIDWLDPTAYRLSIAPDSDPKPSANTATPPKPAANDAGPPRANQVALLTPPANMQNTGAARANGPVETLSPEALARKLSVQLRDDPRDLCNALDHQLLQLLQDEQVPQLPAISSLNNQDREIAAAILDALSNFRNGIRADATMLSNRKIRPIMEMADRLRSQAELRIPTAALCTAVSGFGAYEPIEPAQFMAGRDNPAILYCEIENFSSQLNDKRQWETRLTQETVLYTEAGVQVWAEKKQAIQDVCRNRRHDFFVRGRIVLPRTLPLGKFILKVTITDEQASRVAETTLPIQMVAQ